MKFLTLSLFAAAFACAFGGCAALDEYDRSYSVNLSDGKQSVGLGVTLHPRRTTGVVLH